MAVAIDDMPASGGMARADVLAGRQIGRAIDGDAVVIPQNVQLTELEMPGKAYRLVVDAFHQAAVAGDHPGPVADQFVAKFGVQMPLGHRHADRHCEALAQRTGGALDTRQFEILRVTGARAVQLAEVANVLDRRTRIARQVQQRIDQHRSVSGRKHETIAIGPVGRAGIELEILAKQHRGDIGHAHRHTRMAAIRSLNRIHRQGANGIGEILKLNGHRPLKLPADPRSEPRCLRQNRILHMQLRRPSRLWRHPLVSMVHRVKFRKSLTLSES